MTDQPATEPARIDVPVTSLIEAVRFVDAFAESFSNLPRIVGEEYKQVLRELWPEVVDGVNERAGGTVSTDDPAAFINEALKYANELSIELRDHINRAGVEITDYATLTNALPD